MNSGPGGLAVHCECFNRNLGSFRSSSVRERKMHWLPLVKAWSGICGRHGLVVYDTRKVVWLWELSNLGVSPCCQASTFGYLKLVPTTFVLTYISHLIRQGISASVGKIALFVSSVPCWAIPLVVFCVWHVFDGLRGLLNDSPTCGGVPFTVHSP